MKLLNTDAIVLRSYNLAEADRIVVCLTRTHGLVRGVAKGARRMKSRFGAALEPFTIVRLTFYERENRELVTISNAEILESHFDLNAQIESAEVLAYMGELIAEFAPPHEADEKMFRMLKACVDALTSNPDARRIVTRYFEIWLLRLAGLFPELEACSRCGAAIADAVAVFIDSDVQVYCHNCRIGAGSGLSAENVRILRATEQLAPVRFAATYEISDNQDVELSELTHRLIARALEKRPRTLIASGR